jgi:DNA polymerase III alpha subunit
MLGLYVSSHPLDGTERILEAARDTPIAELLASGRTDGFARIAGIISGLQRKVTKKGSPWAIVTLEDHDASVECLASWSIFCSKTIRLPLTATSHVRYGSSNTGSTTLQGGEAGGNAHRSGRDPMPAAAPRDTP